MNKPQIYTSLDALPASAASLFSDAGASAGIFSSLPWFRNLFATVPEIAQGLRIYHVETNGNAGMLLMRREARGRLSGAANFYSSLFGPLGSKDGSMQSVLNALAAAIADDTPRWHTIDLHPMAADSPLFGSATDAFRHAGMVIQSYFCFGNWYLEVNGRSYLEYFETLPSTLKNTLRRKARQLEAANNTSIKIINSLDDAEEAVTAFEAVYRSSWKEPEPYPGFMPGLIRTCAREGWLRMGLAYVDGKPAAAQLWIVCNGVASIYKLAYDEQFARLSIGSQLTARLMQHVIDADRVRVVDYLTGDEPYKQDWMSHRRERWGIIAFNLRTLRGILAASTHIGGRALKNLVKSAAKPKLPNSD